MGETRIERVDRAGALEALRPVAEAARGYASHAKSANTLRAYRADWAHFTGWTAAHGLVALPASPETLALYVAGLAGERKVATITRRLASIAEAHRAAALEPATSSAPVRAVLAGIRREKGTVQTRKAVPTTSAATTSPAGIPWPTCV